jgi:hypothetical protein
MDMPVTVGAVLKSRRAQVVKRNRDGISASGATESGRAIMAFQTHSEDHRPPQQPRIRGAVRKMADLTAFYTDRRMLEHEWPALLLMTLETGLFVGQNLVHHVRPVRHSPRRRECPVRVMAVGARHDTFVDAVFEWHGELRANVGMASIAKLGLHAGQQEFRRRRFVDRMAVGAHHLVFRVG